MASQHNQEHQGSLILWLAKANVSANRDACLAASWEDEGGDPDCGPAGAGRPQRPRVRRLSGWRLRISWENKKTLASGTSTK